MTVCWSYVPTEEQSVTVTAFGHSHLGVVEAAFVFTITRNGLMPAAHSAGETALFDMQVALPEDTLVPRTCETQYLNLVLLPLMKTRTFHAAVSITALSSTMMSPGP